MDEVGHRLGQLVAHQLALVVVAGFGKGGLHRLHGLGQHRLVGDHRFLRQPLELARNVGQRHLGVGGGHRQRLRLFDQARLHRQRRLRGRRVESAELRSPVAAAAGHRAQQAAGGVEGEQRLGHRRLHAEHVDQEAQRAEVAGQAFDGRAVGAVAVGLRQRVDIVAHAHHRLRGVVDTEHREHAAHGVQLPRHRVQLLARRRLAEESVDGLFGFRQRTAQLLHHAAHRLAVGDAAVQLLHPGFERLGLGAALHIGDALGQAAHAVGLGRVVELGIVERGLEVQHRGGDFHRQGRRRRGAGRHRLRGDAGQRLRQLVAGRVQALQGIADQLELLVERGQAVQLATSHRRPAFLGRADAPLGLRDPGRVEAAELGRQIIYRRATCQLPGQAHVGQARGTAAGAWRCGLGAEEEQVLRQTLGDFTRLRRIGALADAQLRQQPRGNALAVDIQPQQALGLGFEEGTGHLPQRGQPALGA